MVAPKKPRERKVAPNEHWAAEAREAMQARGGMTEEELGTLVGARQPSVWAVLNCNVGASKLVDRISRALGIASPVPLPEDAEMLRKLQALKAKRPGMHERFMALIDEELKHSK
jgi:hypothetical protein